MKSCTINMGHTLQGADTGARGIDGIKEEVLTRQIGEELANILKAEGIATYISRVDKATTLSESLNEQVRQCNIYNADLNVCIHTNAYKEDTAKGVEIYTYKGFAHPEALRILDELTKLGFAIRESYPVKGIKSQNLALINNTKSRTLYLELGFITNPYDVSIIKNYGANEIAKVIAKGILGRKLSTEIPKSNNNEESMPNAIYKIPETIGYIEQTSDGRLIIHRDEGNYIAIGKGFVDIYWNDEKGNKGNKRLSK